MKTDKRKREKNRIYRLTHKKEFAQYSAMARWREGLSIEEQKVFDRLDREGRIKVIYGARSVLCDVGNGLAKGHWIPDLPVELADVWNQEPLSPNWFSEKGRANLERIGRNIEKERQKKELRAEERDLDREIAEDEEDEIDDGALIL